MRLGAARRQMELTRSDRTKGLHRSPFSDLLEVERLSCVDDVNGLVDVELIELALGQRKILGGVQTRSVALEHHAESER